MFIVEMKIICKLCFNNALILQNTLEMMLIGCLINGTFCIVEIAANKPVRILIRRKTEAGGPNWLA